MGWLLVVGYGGVISGWWGFNVYGFYFILFYFTEGSIWDLFFFFFAKTEYFLLEVL